MSMSKYASKADYEKAQSHATYDGLVQRLRDREALVVSGLFHAGPAMQEAAAVIEALRAEMAAIAVAVGRSKTDGYDVDWFELHKECAQRSETARNTKAGEWLPLIEMFNDDHVLLHGAAGEDAMNIGDVRALVQELAERQAQPSAIRPIAALHKSHGLTAEMIQAHYPESQHMPDECEMCDAIHKIAQEAINGA